MFRQVVDALGIAAVIAILGTSAPSNVLTTFRNGWACMALACVADAVAMLAVQLVRARHSRGTTFFVSSVYCGF
jgi:hypothetical protein